MAHYEGQVRQVFLEFPRLKFNTYLLAYTSSRAIIAVVNDDSEIPLLVGWHRYASRGPSGYSKKPMFAFRPDFETVSLLGDHGVWVSICVSFVLEIIH